MHKAHPLLMLQHVLMHQVLLLEQELLLLLQRRLLLRHILWRQCHPRLRASPGPRIAWRRLHSSLLSCHVLTRLQSQRFQCASSPRMILTLEETGTKQRYSKVHAEKTVGGRVPYLRLRLRPARPEPSLLGSKPRKGRRWRGHAWLRHLPLRRPSASA